MILGWDTETTGVPARGMAPEHPDYPHLVQFAAILADDDGTERACLSMIIRPDGWTIPGGAAAVHGITTELALDAGLPLGCAVAMFDRMARRADTLVGHNVEFDLGIMEAAYHRHVAAAVAQGQLVGALKAIIGDRRIACTKDLASPIVNMPPTAKMRAAGFIKPKPPKLEECIRHFFGEELTGAHDALVDVRACLRVFFHLQKLGAETAAEAVV